MARNNGKNFKSNDKKKFYKNDRSVNDRQTKSDSLRNNEGRTNGDKLSSLNDVSWYKRYPELLEASARIAFPNRPGMAVDMGTGKIVPNSVTTITDSAKYDIPGVASMRWIPSFARSESATDPTSIAAREIYAKVRSKFSGSLDADAPDFIMYMGALDSIYSYIGALKRIYRILDVYTPQNYILPDGLLKGMFFTDDAINQLRMDKANFNLSINQLIRMTKKFAMPAAMDLFVRHYWMNDNVYTDRADINSQFYVFVQHAFYKYSPQNTPDGVSAAGLELVEAPWGDLAGWSPSTNGAVADLYNFGTDMINALSEWDDCYTISGYLMRAYEGVNQFTVDELPIHDNFTPVYVPEVLMQIENSVGIMSYNNQTINNLENVNVSQDPKTNAVIYKPVLSSSALIDGSDYSDVNNWINVHENNPTSDTIVVATRLHPVLSKRSDNKFDIYSATEIPLGWNVVIRYTSSSGVVQSRSWGVPQFFSFGYDKSDADYWVTTKERMMILSTIFTFSAFDYHPLINVWQVFTENSKNNTFTYMLGDVSNFTVVPDDVMFNIHRVCTYSELNAFTE